MRRKDDLRREYDFSSFKGAIRGKNAARFREGTNPVLLPPDVAEHFGEARSVNAALRALIQKRRRPQRHARAKPRQCLSFPPPATDHWPRPLSFSLDL